MKNLTQLQQFLIVMMIFGVHLMFGSVIVKASAVTAPTNTMEDITAHLTKSELGKNGNNVFFVPIKSVSANYVRNGMPTAKTSKLEITLAGETLTAFSDGEFTSLKLYLANGDNNSLSSTSMVSLPASGKTWVEKGTYEIPLNGLKVSQDLTINSLIRSYNSQVDSQNYKISLSSQKFLDLKPTITSTLSASSTKISGTGTQIGDTITVNEGSKTKTTTVDKDGNWTLDWGKNFTAGATVNATESDDYGDNPGTTTTKVASRTLHMVLTSSNSVSITAGGSTEIDGLVASDGDDNLTNKDVTVHAALSNGNKIDDFTLNGDDSGLFYLKLLGSQLDVGKNIVTLYATDKDGNKSNTVTVNVNVTGNVSLKSVSKSVSFTTTEIPTSETLVKMADNLDVEVQDDRAAGKSWAVYATASSMKSSKHVLKGNTVYVDSSGAKNIMTNQSTLVGSGKSTGSATTTNLSKNWTGTSGIFLDVQPGIYAGSYTGTIDWSLQDTPKN